MELGEASDCSRRQGFTWGRQTILDHPSDPPLLQSPLNPFPPTGCSAQPHSLAFALGLPTRLAQTQQI